MNREVLISGVPNLSSEVKQARFGDKRLTKRLGIMMEAISANPTWGIPRLCETQAALEGTYRFLNNDRVTPQTILAPHLAATCERTCEGGEAIVIHDTTIFCFEGEGEREGLCQITKTKQGFFGHFALAISSEEPNTPYGVIGLHTYTRTGDKGRRTSSQILADPSRESLRWANLVAEVEQRLQKRASCVHVMDREADSYELFDFLLHNRHRFVIRIFHDRVLTPKAEGKKIFGELKSAQAVYEREVPLSPRKKSKMLGNQKYQPARGYRVARLTFSASALEIACPTHLESRCAPSHKLNIVHVKEQNPPAGLDPVDWKLITSDPIETTEQIVRIVDTYRKRWTIEEYFKALKTGCAYEKRQLESKRSLLNALALFIPIAWRLLLLRSLSRYKPETDPTTALTKTQLDVLKACSKKKLPPKITAYVALMAVAAMGGHIPNNGPPGWLVLGRGYDKLLTLEQGWIAALQGCDQS